MEMFLGEGGFTPIFIITYATPTVVLCVQSGKYCIGLCQSLQILALRLHSLNYAFNVFDCLLMLFWREKPYTINVLYRHGVSPFYCGC